jgi:hypothetical protein
VSPDHPKYTRCTKMHLTCCFVPSSELIYCLVNVRSSFFKPSIFIFPNCLDQDRRNDIIRKKLLGQVGLPLSQGTTASQTRSCTPRFPSYQPGVPSKNIASERDHCNPLTQSSTVSSGFRCHIRNMLLESEQAVEKTSRTTSPKVSPPPWIHVFSKSCSTSSLRTQCAAAALWVVSSPRVLHRRSCRAKKKQRKQVKILKDIVLHDHHFKLSTDEIDQDIIVFDGGDPSTPPIRPPDDIIWRSVPVRELHIEDKIRCDVGLTFRQTDKVG